ncbi:hypothetical protein [Arthrobacter sp. JSM 101049]|uniref:hypothetical protein n=1 Tax=Arthrobacter sp. JSM 101049 TaxID=929097 RepID=UPI0035632186
MPEAAHPSGARAVRESGATPSPWLSILRQCVLVTGIAVVVIAVVALVASGPAAAGSALGAGAVVIAFFGISLGIGHVVGRRNPSAAFGGFMIGYIVKVVVLGVLAFGLGTPAWLDGTWLLIGVVATVVIWQVVELRAFSRLRLQLYNDPIAPPPADQGGDR